MSSGEVGQQMLPGTAGFGSADLAERAREAMVQRALYAGAELSRRLAEERSGEIARAGLLLADCFRSGNKVLLFGNGGSAADAQHVSAEFTGRFTRDRAPLPAIALTCDTSAITAIGNDYGYEHVFARQLRALGREGDVAFAISTSGNSPNVVLAAETARALCMPVIALTGPGGGKLGTLADILLEVPPAPGARLQECHLAIEHILCEIVEAELFWGLPDGTD